MKISSIANDVATYRSQYNWALVSLFYQKIFAPKITGIKYLCIDVLSKNSPSLKNPGSAPDYQGIN